MNKAFQKWYRKNKKKFSFMPLVVISLVFAAIIFAVINATILGPEYTITRVHVTEKSLKALDDPALYQQLEKKLKGKNSLVSRFFEKNRIVTSLKQSYPAINTLSIQYANQEAAVDITFRNPTLIFNLSGQNIAVYSSQILDLSKDSTLLENRFKITLPSYITGLDQSAFFDVSLETLKAQVESILVGIPETKEITYYIGGSKMEVKTPLHTLFLDNKKDIVTQINKYSVLKQYSTPDKSLSTGRVINLGAIDDGVVIK